IIIFLFFFFFFFFFFQAEDGIRDKLVTGVQTCALPIYSFASPLLDAVFGDANEFELSWERFGNAYRELATHVYVGRALTTIVARSEERRVGKECRWRGWTEE